MGRRLLTTVLLLLVSGAAASWVWATPAGAQAPPRTTEVTDGALPDQLWVPPGQVLDLGSGDVFEPVAALMNGVHRQIGLFDSGLAVAVVGRDSGEYRFLEMDRLEASLNRDDGRVGLAADGSRLVWVEPEGPITVRVWDPSTGDVRTHRLTQYSDQAVPKLTMSPDGSQIALQVAELRRGEYEKSARVMDLDSGLLTRVPSCAVPIGWSNDGTEVLCSGDVLRAVSTETGEARTLGRFPDATWPVMLSPDERYATAASDPGREPVVVDLRSGTQRPLEAADAPAQEQLVEGWVDDRTVVVLDRETGLVAVDVVDGSTEPLVDVPESVLDYRGFRVASGLLTEPPFAAPEPDWPMDPRLQILLVIGGIAAVLIGGLLLMEFLVPNRPRRIFRRRRATG